jgi:dTDP-4-amino-4,6-dideoxygalactose transaminase
VDVGSSFLPGELTAAFLWAQLEAAQETTAARLRLWDEYYGRCAALETAGIRRPVVPADVAANGHLFYLLLPADVPRADLLAALNQRGVNAIFHYVPLHDSEAGRRYGRVAGSMDVTDDLSRRLIRLPLWVGMGPADTDAVMEGLTESLAAHARF